MLSRNALPALCEVHRMHSEGMFKSHSTGISGWIHRLQPDRKLWLRKMHGRMGAKTGGKHMNGELKIMWGPKQVEEYRRKKLERLERRLEGDRNET